MSKDELSLYNTVDVVPTVGLKSIEVAVWLLQS